MNRVKVKRFADQNLRKVVLNNALRANASKVINFKENRPNLCVVPRAVGSTEISSLVVNKWSMPLLGRQSVPVHATNIAESGPLNKIININGKRIPMKVLEIIPATQFKMPIRPSSDNSQESVMHTGTYDLGEQADLRQQVKRISEQNAQILAGINRSKEFAGRVEKPEDVDKFEEKIETNLQKKNLAIYLRKRIKNKSDVVMEVLGLVFTDEVISEFNVHGLRKKRSFKKLHLDTVVRVLSGLKEKAYYLELARCIHTITARYHRAQNKVT